MARRRGPSLLKKKSVVVVSIEKRLVPCARARLRSGLRLAAHRASEATRPTQYDKRSANSTWEVTSSRLLWIWLPWSVLWRPELREGVDVQPRARGQVASRPDSQPNYPPRLESRIKTVEVHLLLGICVCVCVSRSSASLCPLSAGSPGASVWPSPRPMPGSSPSL